MPSTVSCPVCGAVGHDTYELLGITFLLCPAIPEGDVMPVEPPHDDQES